MMKKTFNYFGISLIILFLYTISACATKAPVLYRDGEPLSIVEYEKIAQKEFEYDHYDNAIRAYKAVIKNYPENSEVIAWANYEIGFCYYVQKKYKEAEICFRKVINEYQDPTAKKLAEEMVEKIVESQK